MKLSLGDFGGAVAVPTPCPWSPSDYSKQPILEHVRQGTPYFASVSAMSGQLVGPEADCNTLGIFAFELLVGGSDKFKSWAPLGQKRPLHQLQYLGSITKQFASGQLLPDLHADTPAMREAMDMARTFMAVACRLKERPTGHKPPVASSSSSSVATNNSAHIGSTHNGSTNSAEPIVPTALGLLKMRWIQKTTCSRMPTEQCPVCSGPMWVQEASPATG